MSAGPMRRSNDKGKKKRHDDRDGGMRGRRIQGNGGFTLVELIVVLVVLGILCTLAVMSIIGWQDYADFRQNNEAAQSVFSAAQIQLTQYAERGQLSVLKNAVTGDGKEPTKGYLLLEQGDLDAAWQSGNSGNIYFISVKKGDYAVYQGLKGLKEQDMKGKTIEERRIWALYQMIDPYITDKAMLDAAICIEFDPDPKTAQIFSVFYNANANGFTYGQPDKDRVQIRERSSSARKEDKTGYYGVETMSRATDPGINKPVITNLRLNNEDTLNLTWSTKNAGLGDDKDLISLVYSIAVYKESDDKEQEPLKLLEIDALGSTEGTIPEEAQVGGGCINGMVNGVEYRFPITYSRTDRTLTLVLDGLDLSADEQDAAGLKDTASIQRFGSLASADEIFVEISGSKPSFYNATAKKKSNSEHALFARKTMSEDNTVIFGIENARHLHNIRFKEKELLHAQTKAEYQIRNDINWEYALNSGSVYDHGTVQWPEGGDVSGYCFRPLSVLRKESSLMSEPGGRIRSLKRFCMDINHMGLKDGETSAIGLTAENRGTIRDLMLEDVSVNGIRKDQAGNVLPEQSATATGGFAGKNTGTLSNLTVKRSAETMDQSMYNHISGYFYVGAMAGMTKIPAGAAANKAAYENLVNRIPVTGQQYVGGIAGGLVNHGNGMVTVDRCENYGKVYGEKINPARGIYFFGGIAGYTELPEVSAGQIRLSDCKSSPYYSENEIDELLRAIREGETDALAETFAGGIVGFNDGAVIANCNTVRESAQKQGYMVGKDYVGGIVGYNSGRAGALQAKDGNNRNQLHVIGHSYVGGIVGCNAAGTLDSSREPYSVQLTAREYTAETAAVLDWINEGIVTATGDYVGGITGYNGETGLIVNSYSSVLYGGSTEKLTEVSSNARYAGGVAGYNKGIITNRDARYGASGTDDVVSVVSVIHGKDYVGGVAGWNDVGGEIHNYALNGGYITGSHFVGGFVGLNMEKTIFESYIQSDPNQVTGDYFVGGILGANLLPVAGNASLRARFGTDNFLGKLSAENGAFAGGFIGYNYLLKENTAELIVTAAEQLCGLKPLESQDGSLSVNPEKAVADVFKTLGEGISNPTASMLILGDGETDSATELLNHITANVYVGGVVGYNNPDTKLTIKNVENVSLVEATGFLRLKEGNASEEHDYSYAGGIIGKVEANVTLDNCRNKDTGSVTSKGTYTGGLAEINYGTIKNCHAGNIGDGTASYIGGLVGVNGSKTLDHGAVVRGKITNCYPNGQIYGVSYVGGLAAENYGEIEYDAGGARYTAVVNASGAYAGGITGYAHRGGTIRFGGEVELDINIDGSAAYAGQIAGVNAGNIEIKEGSQVSNREENVIIGRRNVGGFIGMQIGPDTAGVGSDRVTITGLTNRAHVQASGGYAGGIVAVTDTAADKLLIRNCENYGTVEVLAADELADDSEGSLEGEPEGVEDEVEDAALMTAGGGITAINRGRIESCGNYGKIRAGSGALGGIAALNDGVIKNSETAGRAYDDEKMDDSLTLTGDLYTGGIVAVNEKGGVIESSAVRNLILRNQEDSRHGFLGGIAAQNKGRIEACQVGVPFDARAAHTGSDYDFGIDAGSYVQKGMEKGFTLLEDNDTTIGYSVALISNASDVVMGGVAGENSYGGVIAGRIKNSSESYSTVAADLHFDGNGLNYFGNIGGIAGVNHNEISGYEFNGYVKGEANDPSKSPSFGINDDLEQSGFRVYGYGGIVGLNGSDRESLAATVKKCRLGMARIEGTGDAGNRTNVGGVAGFNGMQAEINGISFSDETGYAGNLFSYTHKNIPESTHRASAYGDLKTYAGTVWVTADTYGHVGGVAGFNHGTITGIGWDSDYESARNKDKNNMSGGYFENGSYVLDTSDIKTLAKADMTSVLVTTKAGHVGGIAGYNRRNGLISRAVTGRYWLVYAETQQQDNGAGGIIGYNISEQDLTLCDNHATVAKRSEGNAVGGMVGRNENNTTSSWRFYDCHNYGNISAKERAGGLIGNIKNKGGTLENCLNFGAVTADNGTAIAGGIVGYVYGGLSGETLNLVHCENHGAVGEKSRNAAFGGIVGSTYRSSYPMGIRFDGCVNTGMIGGGSKTGGILGTSNYENNRIIFMTYCRNYGYSSINSSEFYGLTSVNIAAKDSFGVTGKETVHPTGKAGSNAGSYYFAEKADTAESAFWVRRIAANGLAADNPTNIKNIGRMINGEAAKANGNFYFEAASLKNSFEFEFNKPVKLDSMTLNWPGTSDGRKQDYQIRFKNGEEVLDRVIEVRGAVGEVGYENLEGMEVTSVIIDDIIAYKEKPENREKVVLYQFSAEGTPQGCSNPTGMTPVKEDASRVVWSPNDRMTTIYTPDAPVSTVTKDDNGMPLYIIEEAEPHYAVDINSQKVIENVAGYTAAQIYQPERATDQTLSYRLCKGAAANEQEKKQGLDELLVFGPQQGDLPVPTGLHFTTDTGEYKVAWNGSDSAGYYIVTCIYETGNGSVKAEYATFSPSYIISTAVEKDGAKAAGVSVTVRACRGDRVSGFSDALDITFGKRLPYPKIRWKLSGEDGYWVELLNREDYVAFAKENLTENDSEEALEKALEAIRVNTSGFHTAEFPVKDGGKKENGTWKKYTSSFTGNIYFNSYADYVGEGKDIIRSVTTALESRIPGWGVYTGEKMAVVRLEKTAQTSGVGFSGTTVRELAYNVKMRGETNSWVPELRTEMIADDPVLNVPVAISVSEQTRLSTSGSSMNTVTLGGLPEDFLDREKDGKTYKYKNVQVRAYPTKMTNDVVCQGWNVDDRTYRAEELELMYVTEDGEIVPDAAGKKKRSGGVRLISRGKVQPGYVIVRAGKGADGSAEYKLYYNALLKALEKTKGYDPTGKNLPPEWAYTEGGSALTYQQYQVFFHFIDLEKELQQTVPTPVLYASAEYDAKTGSWRDGAYDEEDMLVLTWDQAGMNGKPAYTEGNGYEEKDYRDAVYRLTITGEKGGTATTLVNRISIYTPDRTGDSYNTYRADASTWDYDNITVTITRVGREQDSLTTIFPATAVRSFPMRKRLLQPKDVTAELAKDETGVIIQDSLGYVLSFAGVTGEAELAALDYYQIEISSRDKENPSETVTLGPVEHITDTSGIRLDLDTFRGGEEISVAVQAIAKTGDQTYRSSFASAAAELTVPSRLAKPEMGISPGGSENNLTADNKDTLSASEFKNGCITLSMKKEEDTPATLRYQIALELYDSVADLEHSENALVPAGQDGEALLPDKKHPASMTYSGAEAKYDYTLKDLPVDYAGKYLKVVMRSTGSSHISSVWTDMENPGNAEDVVTKEYMWFRLPRVQIDPVEFTEHTDVVEYERPIMTPEGNLQGEQVTASQIQAGFALAEHADRYHITLIQEPQQADRSIAADIDAANYVVSHVHEMTLARTAQDDEYELEYRSTKLDDDGNQMKKTMKLKVNGGEQALPFTEVLLLTDDGYHITLESAVRLEAEADGPARLIFTLPDCADVTDHTEYLGVQKMSEQIMVQAVADEADGNYVDSKWALLYWSGDSLNGMAELELAKDALIPELEYVIPAKGITNTAYQILISGRGRYLVSVSDRAGKELGVYAVPYDKTYSVDGSNKSQVWLPSIYAKYAEQELELRFCSIFDVSGTADGMTGGLSAGYTTAQTVSLPAIETAVTVVSRTAGEETRYPVAFQADTPGLFPGGILRTGRDGRKTGTITARQKQLVWEYDMGETAVTGYKVELKGEGMDSGYVLDIDLTRGMSGSMPGLSEYLADGGKRLYSVSYHVDGDLLLQLGHTGTATASDAEMATASNAAVSGKKATDSNLATDSNSDRLPEPGVLTLECSLKAEFVTGDGENRKIRFTLTLPDLSYDDMPEEAARLYLEAFPDGLYQTESFRLDLMMRNRYYRKEDTELDLAGLRGELEDDRKETKE